MSINLKLKTRRTRYTILPPYMNNTNYYPLGGTIRLLTHYDSSSLKNPKISEVT